MRYKGTLIAVKDIEKSKKFYKDLFGLEVVGDFGANVVLTGNLFLQTAETWKNFIHKDENQIIFENNAVELYFEEDDIDLFFKKLNDFGNIIYVHQPIEHSWGQRVVRLYDPDNHIIEVGENLGKVINRFSDEGLSAEETAIRMDVPLEYIKENIEGEEIVYKEWKFNVNRKASKDYYSSTPVLYLRADNLNCDLTNFFNDLMIDIEKPFKITATEVSYYYFGTADSDMGYELDFYGKNQFISVVIKDDTHDRKIISVFGLD